MLRMLTLHQQSLLSDRPLPVKPALRADGLTAKDDINQTTCTATGIDSHGYPNVASPWAVKFGLREQRYQHDQEDTSAGEIGKHFGATVHALRNGLFAAARQSLHASCASGQRTLDIWHLPHDYDAFDLSAKPPPQINRNTVMVVKSWQQECTLLLGYMPMIAPSREDHKRLLMLLHDLGSSLLLTHLYGLMPVQLLDPMLMVELYATSTMLATMQHRHSDLDTLWTNCFALCARGLSYV